MARFKRVLVSTDLSRLSQAAFPYASTLARRHGARIFLTHVMEPPPPVVPTALGMSTAAFERRISEDAKRTLEKFCRQFGRKVRVDIVLRKGNVADQLTQVAKAKKVDVIVICTHGRSGLRHVFVGSVAERVVRTAPCAVLTVKPRRP